MSKLIFKPTCIATAFVFLAIAFVSSGSRQAKALMCPPDVLSWPEIAFCDGGDGETTGGGRTDGGQGPHHGGMDGERTQVPQN